MKKLKAVRKAAKKRAVIQSPCEHCRAARHRQQRRHGGYYHALIVKCSDPAESGCYHCGFS